MPDFRVIEGDALAVLPTLEAASVQTCITSPPYYGLRDYGHDGQIGLEETPEQYVAKLVSVFREVRRVLRDDGTLWLNLGDSYAGGLGTTGRNDTDRDTPGGRGGSFRGGEQTATNQRSDCKPKDLLGIPWMVAFALRADGWYLRSDIIWAKPNPMPESVTDRPTKAHEYLFLLSKLARYYYDADAVRESFETADRNGERVSYPAGSSSSHNLDMGGHVVGHGPGLPLNDAGRNRRSVWTVATQPFPGAHFATFPPKLIEPCVLAGSSPQACAECGAPWQRVTETVPDGREREPVTSRYIEGSGRRDGGRALVGTTQLVAEPSKTIGWQPTCDHDAGTGVCTVLDPFNGAGTTGMVALRHDRDYIGIELNPDYAQMSRDRIYDDGPLLNVENAA